ncbi:MAG: hypothetical protein ACYSR6_14870 [Planctomycetota bacterium]|jgi:hypothetical protein
MNKDEMKSSLHDVLNEIGDAAGKLPLDHDDSDVVEQIIDAVAYFHRMIEQDDIDKNFMIFYGHFRATDTPIVVVQVEDGSFEVADKEEKEDEPVH